MTLSSFTILVVDDCAAQYYAISRSLEQADAKVIRAYTGTEALRRSGDKPDAILLDINLPDVHGLEVCRRILANPDTCAIPVVLVTASSQDEPHVHGLRVSGRRRYCSTRSRKINCIA